MIYNDFLVVKVNCP